MNQNRIVIVLLLILIAARQCCSQIGCYANPLLGAPVMVHISSTSTLSLCRQECWNAGRAYAALSGGCCCSYTLSGMSNALSLLGICLGMWVYTSANFAISTVATTTTTTAPVVLSSGLSISVSLVSVRSRDSDF